MAEGADVIVLPELATSGYVFETPQEARDLALRPDDAVFDRFAAAVVVVGFAETDADSNPWRAAFEAASKPQPDLGEFAPNWLYSGPAAIERHVPMYLLSRDRERYERLKKDMTLHRLTLGQPRQEDMLALLEQRGVDPSAVEALDLRPPQRDLTDR